MAEETSSRSGVLNAVRTRVARVLGLACGLCAVLLVAGALCVALRANQDNALVGWVLLAADRLDLVVFDRTAGVFVFEGARAAAKDALVNWGLAAVVWLVVGRVLAGLVRP